MTDDFLPWAAGYFDGEGCIMLVRGNKNARSRTLTAAISTTDPDSVRLFHERWGGHFSNRPQRGDKWKAATAWQITGEGAAQFLREIQPFVRSLKNKRRIEIALLFQSGKRGRGQRTSDIRMQHEDQLYNVMKHLNTRGPLYDESDYMVQEAA